MDHRLQQTRTISIHAPREGGDLGCCAAPKSNENFNPRPPRGGRHIVPTAPAPDGGISIHAPREGGDVNTVPAALQFCRFQSTPPARGATLAVAQAGQVKIISIHAPREGGDKNTAAYAVQYRISIHAPREGGDAPSVICVLPGSNFNPRPPRGGRPTSSKGMRKVTIHFNPRPPRGGRRSPTARIVSVARFQSTPPARGATCDCCRQPSDQGISIHAPREGGDCPKIALTTFPSDFNPRPPRGGRPAQR